MQVVRILAAVALVCAASTAGLDRAHAGKRPKVGARAAVVIDLDSGAELYAKDADEIRPIASMTKLFVALAVRRKGLDLEGWSAITEADVEASRGGARTRLRKGQVFRNHDLLRAMLMSSDNRAPTALGRAVGLDTVELILEMNAVARDLGLTHSRFLDTTGILGNTSTAREMTVALRAVLADPVLARIMATEKVRLVSKTRASKVDYRSTVEPLRDGKYTVHGGKTGHTEPAGYCITVSLDVAGRSYVVALLGSPTKKRRSADFSRITSWLESGAARTASKTKVAASR